MKKYFVLFLSLIVLASMFIKAYAVGYSEAVAQSDKRPVAVYLYADWIDNRDVYRSNFSAMQKVFGKKYSYVSLNIGSSEAKDYLENNQINPKLPHLILKRSGGKVSRFIDRDCFLSQKCVESKMQSFLR